MREVIRFTPDNPGAYGNLVGILTSLSRLAEAEKVYEDAFRRRRTGMIGKQGGTRLWCTPKQNSILRGVYSGVSGRALSEGSRAAMRGPGSIPLPADGYKLNISFWCASQLPTSRFGEKSTSTSRAFYVQVDWICEHKATCRCQSPCPSKGIGRLKAYSSVLLPEECGTAVQLKGRTLEQVSCP
jgi:hypothetical protein